MPAMNVSIYMQCLQFLRLLKKNRKKRFQLPASWDLRPECDYLDYPPRFFSYQEDCHVKHNKYKNSNSSCIVGNQDVYIL